MSLVKSSVGSPLYLVVDDLIAPNKTLQKKFIEQFGIPLKNALFAEDYQTATNLIDSNSNIAVCFVDCIIPESQAKRDLLKPVAPNQKPKPMESFDDLAQWGRKIVAEHKTIKMFVFSAHLTQRQLIQLKQTHDNVVEVAEKPLQKKKIDSVAKKFIIPYFPPQEADKVVSSLVTARNSNPFDYESLEPELAAFVRAKTNLINLKATRIACDIHDIGKTLLAVKDKLAFGKFRAWIKAEFPWSKSQASRFMRVAEVFEPSNLEEVNIFPSSLFELSATTVPASAREEVLALAQQGQVINTKIVHEVKERHLEPVIKEIENIPLEATQKKGNLQILNVIPGLKENSYWELGNNRLFCGNPSDKKFLKQVPKDIKICFDFSPPENPLSSLPPVSSESGITYFPNYENMDLRELERKVENLILGQTEGGDIILFSYLYHPRLFALSVQQECICYIAEPNLSKCQSILDLWRKVGEISRIKL